MPRTDTALAIAQGVAASIGIKVPDSLTAPTSDSRQLLTLLNRSGQTLASKRGAFRQGWPELTRRYEFTTQAGENSYALPDGFEEIIGGTAWEEGTYRRSAGPLTPQEWQAFQAGVVGSLTLSLRHRIAFDPDHNSVRMFLDPTPDRAATVSYEYLSRYWVRPSETSPISADVVSQDSHLPVFPSRLMSLALEFRLRQAMGVNRPLDLAEYELERDRLFAQASSLRDVSLAPGPSDFLDALDTPEGSWPAE